jgi:hypothetical protein
MPRIRPQALALIAAALLTSQSALAVQRTFVASTGSDVNTATNCGFVNPCRSFTAAMAVTDPGGEVVALDAAGYGAVTITKSITLTSNSGFYAGIAASSGSAVTIATAGVKVTLRGLAINGVGASRGVEMSAGARLAIENCVISNFLDEGVQVSTAAEVRVVDTIVRDNGSYGINLSGAARAAVSGAKLQGNYIGLRVVGNGATPTNPTSAAVSDSVASGNNLVGFYVIAPTAGTAASMAVTRSTSAGNVYGFAVDLGSGASTLIISSNLVTDNSTVGLYQNGSNSVIRSQGNNTVERNGANAIGTITPMAGM